MWMSFCGDGRVGTRVVGVVKATYTVHRLPVVPNDKIVRPPLMNVDEFRLGCMFNKITQIRPGLRHRPADDSVDMGGQEERLATRDGVGADEPLPHGLESFPLLLRELGEAEQTARKLIGPDNLRLASPSRPMSNPSGSVMCK